MILTTTHIAKGPKSFSFGFRVRVRLDSHPPFLCMPQKRIPIIGLMTVEGFTSQGCTLCSLGSVWVYTPFAKEGFGVGLRSLGVRG